ncbi:MAG TPA: hypothetical protein VFD88_08760 [Clostridia bacterium]|nr:hypothetical protein [Clostridia bacterium]
MSTASRAVGTPVQVACIAAHVGTGSGLATGIGEGLGVGEGVGLGFSDATSDGVGLDVPAVPAEPQPASANTMAIANTPSLTGDCNAAAAWHVTRKPVNCMTGPQYRAPDARQG